MDRMKCAASELCWFAACCLLVGFLGLYLLGVNLKAVGGWPVDRLLPLIVLAGFAVAGMIALMVAAYRMER
jgi:uncharacterized membrane protein